ncbi:Maltokinase [Streptomyces hundungensis]|uniref:Maltokinase n=1 Tax=Streptomyces hundungensis TaxID=1077946 RepID=A0A387HIB7_9ACTN|nr:maltokinase [Streptomyces hundungensis]AYG80327.1 Maltokinase [Streptomyces hundungensis]
MPKAAPPRTTGLPPARLLTSLAPLLHEWLPRQRWFAGKGRPVTDFVLLTATELLPGFLHLLVRTEHSPAPTPAETASAPADCYQLLIGVRDQLPPRLAPALIGHANQGPLAGRTVYDALHDPQSAALLLERLRTPGTVGPLSFEHDPQVTVPPGLAPRLLGVEQSNTSLVYGDTFILKVFRRVQPGVNPDLELPWALTRQGCERVPAPAAWFHTSEPEAATLGVLQPFLRGADDGWTLALASLAEGRPFTDESYELGRATAEVHLALADAFAPVTLGPAQTELIAAAMTERLDATAQAVPSLGPYVPRLRAAFEAVGALTSAGTAQRVHGDLHLGQALRPADGSWSVIDFEGEPARPLAERRRPQPPVRDVAGMLRSFDYAARTARPPNPSWAEECRAAYCAGYAARSGSDPRESPELLRAYETDKAVYEVLYEARHRPDWLPVPMAAIRRLAGA